MNRVSYLPFPFNITNLKKIKFLKMFQNLDNKFAIEMDCLGVLINILSTFQFSYKFEFILRKN